MSSKVLSRSLSEHVVRSLRPNQASSCRPTNCHKTASAGIRQPTVRCAHQLATSQQRVRPTSLSQQQQQQITRSRFGPRISRRTIFILTENTPNEDALKFKPNQRVLPENFPSPFIEYLSPRSTLAPPNPSQLASKLLNVDGVSSVFFGADYITVTKDAGTLWAHVKPEVFSLITEAVTNGQPMVSVVEGSSSADGASEGQEAGEDSLAFNESDSEVVGMIKELLETRIRPAIQDDGGDIEFRGYEDGKVFLKLRGACRTCDSSTTTLKNGIEGMLMHYIEEVTEVQQVFDEEEEIAMKEFQKFEERLRAQQGYVPPSTTGKGSLDTIEG